MAILRLTMAQALVKYLTAQKVELDGQALPMFAGVWAIFGHGNVAGMGEALYAVREELPTYRAHNEQGMCLAAVAYAKAQARRRMMACTTSIGPGSTNMVTAAAVAHVNRLPVLLLPSDTFTTRAPDPVLQQVENFNDPTITANDCFRPVSRYWDRITRPEQLLTSLPRAIQVLMDPSECGPATLALPQDVQAMAYGYPAEFFAPRLHRQRRIACDPGELEAAAAMVRAARKPMIVAGGGVHYSGACEMLAAFAERHGIPVAETQAGKGALPWKHPALVDSIGVTGSAAANALAKETDLVLAVGTRLADFTTGSWAVFGNPAVKLVSLNVTPFDAGKRNSQPLLADARRGLEDLSNQLMNWSAPADWTEKGKVLMAKWMSVVDDVTSPSDAELPSDAQVVGAVNRAAGPDSVVVCAAGALPAELQKLWRTARPGGYHMEYGYSCMGYEIAGALGVKMALPEREVYVMVGDGSYLMMNSELASAVMLGLKLVLVLLDNRGYGCINRLQQECGSAPFNNLLSDSLQGPEGAPQIDFVAHARALGATAEKVRGIAALESALERAKAAKRAYAIVIDTDPVPTTHQGGAWWDVAVPEVSMREEVRSARVRYEAAKTKQRL